MQELEFSPTKLRRTLSLFPRTENEWTSMVYYDFSDSSNKDILEATK